MRTLSATSVVLTAWIFASACSGSSGGLDIPSPQGVGGATTVGGAPASGGIPSPGGTVGIGGSSRTDTGQGGAPASGGVGPTTGGAPPNGGTTTGGTALAGGAPNGGSGSPTGGKATTGGTATGGVLMTGGGKSTTGGAATGGATTGGAAAGGTAGSGGATVGGAGASGGGSVSITCTPGTAPTGANTALDVCTQYQKITGLGHSFAWTSHNQTEMDLLWDIDKGAGFSIARARIDESTRDQGLIKSTSNQNQITMAKYAISKGVVVWAAPWGPGKDWQTVYGQNAKGQDQIKFNLNYAKQWAAALAQYVKDMKTAGVPLIGLSAQNEPDGDNFNHFEAADMVTWIRDFLGPAMEGTGVPIIAPETVNWCSFPAYKTAIMNDAKASAYVPIIATHEYGCSPKAYPEINQAGKQFWETEIYDDGSSTADPGINSGLRTAKLMHEALVIAGVNAWHYWWGHGGANDGLFPNGSSVPTKRLWVMGNYARFVRPGFVRVAVPASPATGVTMSAYFGGKRAVIVAINTNTSAVSRSFGVAGMTATKVTPWVTDASNNLVSQSAVTVSGNTFTYALPARSVTSLVIDG